MAQAESLRREILQILAGSGGTHLAGSLLGLVVGILLARGLGVAGYGVYGSVMALASLGATVASGGLQLHATRQIARFCGAGDSVAAAVLLWWSVRGLLWVLPALSLAVGCYVLIWQAASLPLAVAAVLVSALTALLTLAGAAVRGLGRVVLGQAMDLTLRPAVHGLLLLTALLCCGALTPSMALSFAAVAALTATIPAVWPLWRLVRSAGPLRMATYTHDSQWRKDVLTMGLATVLRAAELTLPLVIIAAVSSPEETGILRVALSAVILPDLAVSVVMMMAPAMMARSHARGDIVGLRHLVSVCAIAMMIPTMVIVALVWLFGPQMLRLAFGVDYQSAALPLGILAAGSLVTAAGGASIALLHAGRQQKVVTRAFGVSLIIIVAGAWWLAPQMGAKGVAMASLVAVIARTVYLSIQGRLKMGTDPTIFAAINQLVGRRLAR